MRFYVLLFFLSLKVYGSDLPVELSDNLLKVQTIELMRQHLNDKFYNIDELFVRRVRSGETEFAVGVNNIWVSSGKCFSYLIIAESTQCRAMDYCKLVPKIIDCSQFDGLISELLTD